MVPVIAVFDIGRTNKKLILFDDGLKLVAEKQIRIDDTIDDDGFPAEDLVQLASWIRESIAEVEQSGKYSIKAVNTSAYGATFVHLDESGNPVAPVYSYLKPYPDDLLDRFYNEYGGKMQFVMDTASPPMGMLNSGLQLYYIKHRKPDIFSRIRTSLHLPQYCTFLLTGRLCNEFSSIGCHTALWDFRRKDYHRWVYGQGLERLFPKVNTTGISGTFGSGDKSIPVGVGVHDSSSAIVPYLRLARENMFIISTGTWCINLFPAMDISLTEKQIRRDCLLYMAFSGEPVAASRLFIGAEHDYQVRRMSEWFGKSAEHYSTIAFNRDTIDRIARSTDNMASMLIPGRMSGTGPFPDEPAGKWDIRRFNDFEEAYHRLLLDLTCRIRVSVELIRRESAGDLIFVDGGFARNEIFMNLISSHFPNSSVRASRLAQASALGAALSVTEGLSERTNGLEEVIALRQYSPVCSEAVQSYYGTVYRNKSA